MPTLTFGWCISVIPIVAIMFAFIQKRLAVARDWFFLFFYFQSVLYLNLVPMAFLAFPDPEAWGGIPSDELRNNYVVMDLAVVVCFQLPLLLLYTFTGKRGRRAGCFVDRLRMHAGSILFLSVGCIIFCSGFYFALINQGIVRAVATYGNEQLPSVFIQLPTFVFALLRLFEGSGLFLAALLEFVLLSRQKLATLTKGVTVAAFVITSASWLGYYYANGIRSVPIWGICILVGMFFSQRVGFLRRRSRLAKRLVFIALIAGYSLRVSYNLRGGLRGEGFTWQMLNPFETRFTTEIPSTGIHNVLFRLNGLDSMARIRPEATRQGYSWGDSWNALAKVSILQWVDRASVEELKLDRRTDPKMNLLYRYADVRDYIDWPNSMLFDLYGNFSFWGLIGAAVLFWRIFSFSSDALCMRRSPFSVVVATMLMAGTLQFEMTFGAWFFSFLKVIPFCVVVCMIRPFGARKKVVRYKMSAKCVLPSDKLRRLTGTGGTGLPSPRSS